MGDDAAVLPPPAGHLLIATDMMVEGLDFDLSYSDPSDVGWKAAAINVSDIAAMGGRPTTMVATLAMPATTPMSFFDGFLDGLLEACDEFGANLVGGDLSGASEISCSITVLGAAEQPPVMRSGAKKDDLICVTGSLGASAAGLVALKAGLYRDEVAIDEVISRHLRPRPRVDAGAILASGGATAMIDISDGLGLDLLRLCESSGVGCDVSSDSIPISVGVAEVCRETGESPASLALGGGEDQELLCTLPPELVEEVTEACSRSGVPLSVLGVVTDGRPSLDGEDLRTKGGIGWEHLRDR